MAEKLEVYRCEICGIMIETLNDASDHLACCGKPMIQLKENTVDAAHEKHIPVIEKTPDGVKVTVGSVNHPMLNEHYIQWIELIADDKVYRQYLNPDEAPEALFKINAENVTAREYCNLHGLWRS